MSAGQAWDVRRDFQIRALQTHHGGVSLGYSLISVREKLKPEYAGTPGQELARMKKAGVEIQYRIEVPLVTAMRSSGEYVFLSYPLVRLVILLGAVVIGVLMWLALNRTKIGMLVRAGVDDRDMLSATGIRVQLLFLLVFAFGAGLAGFTGVVGGTFQSLQQGEDIKILLASLVVVIVGGMGSITGAAVGAVLIGLADQFGTVYMPTYAVVLTFVIMVVVLALRPQGLMRGN